MSTITIPELTPVTSSNVAGLGHTAELHAAGLTVNAAGDSVGRWVNEQIKAVFKDVEKLV